MRIWAACLLILSVAACSGGSRDYTPLPTTGHYKLGNPYQISGRWYYPEFDPNYDQRGTASWYGSAFHGKPTANGEVFNRHLISAAHPTIPLPSIVEVTNLENGRQMVIRVNDRGPFHDNRIIDLSEAAAKELGFHGQGLADVRVRFLQLATDATGTPPEPAAGPTPANLPSAQTATVSPPSTPTPPVMSSAPICRADQNYVQVAALSDPNRAQALMTQLETLGPVWQDTTATSLHRVRIGPLRNRRIAFDVLSRLHQLGYRQAFVTDCAPRTS